MEKFPMVVLAFANVESESKFAIHIHESYRAEVSLAGEVLQELGHEQDGERHSEGSESHRVTPASGDGTRQKIEATADASTS